MMRRHLALVVFVALVPACDTDEELPWPDGSTTPDGGIADGDAAHTPDGAPPQNLVAVSHGRELRGVWVATVANIDFPTKQGLSAAAQKQELDAIVDVLAKARFNAIFFQVRPEGDALYSSQLEPWSRYLTGTQGKDPGYDPLSYLVDRAHARNLEVHAWFNPYRAKASKSSTAVQPHLSLKLPQYAYTYGSYLWMDPGAKAVQDHVVAVITDVVKRYAVDGIHFDDYFYPYPQSGVDFPDGKTYSAYLNGGGTMSKADWRRDNVNRLIERLGQAIRQARPHVRFGISPFGIYRPGTPPGITGLDQYAAIYADPPKWKQKGWVDYLAPQLYWPSTQTAQAYGTLIAWWAKLPAADRYTFAGNYLSKLGSSSSWSVQEFRTQVALSRAQAKHNSLGNIFFSYKVLGANSQGIVGVFRDELYKAPALPPPVATMRTVQVAPPQVTLAGKTAQVSHAKPASVRGWLVYAAVSGGGGWTLRSVVPRTTGSVQLQPGRWAISAAGLHDVESKGVVVQVP
jgi:uncharacterized lipoprotein YddW (UPF0748 family)